jgi:hypothetical protein
MAQTREELATEVNSETLMLIRSIAQNEGRQLQSLVDEALADFVEKHKKAKSRTHVMAAYLASHERFGPLYKKLAE